MMTLLLFITPNIYLGEGWLPDVIMVGRLIVVFWINYDMGTKMADPNSIHLLMELSLRRLSLFLPTKLKRNTLVPLFAQLNE